MVEKVKKSKVAWGITGGGDKIAEIAQIMNEIKSQYADKVDIHVYVSKNADTMLKFYRLFDKVKQDFANFNVEMNPNAPFLAAMMQSGKYDFLLVAPATSNTVAKIAVGIGDTMLTNAVSMGLKAFAPIYVLPTDFKEGVVSTLLPNGKEIKIRVRKEDAENTRKLEQMDGMHVLEKTEQLKEVFKQRYG